MDIHVKKKGTVHVRRPAAKEPKKKNRQKETRKPEKTKQSPDRHDKKKKETGKKETGKKESRQEVSAARGAAVKQKPAMPDAAVSAAGRTALNEMDGGEEVYQAYIAADVLADPAFRAVRAGRNPGPLKTDREKGQMIRKKQAGSRLRKKTVKESAVEAVKRTAWTKAGEKGRKKAKEASKAAAGAGPGAGDRFAGTMADEAAGNGAGKRDKKNTARSRMIRLFAEKLRQEENQDSTGKTVKDIVSMRFFMAAKHIIRYAGLFLLVLFALTALMALPVIAVLAVIYNSPLAIFFPSISSTETTQDVLSAYTAEFNRSIEEELAVHPGCDTAWKVYAGFEGVEEPDNFSDILAVYMVRYGNGDTATDMTDTAKANLKAVFEDMRSYSVTEETGTIEHEDGTTETSAVKKVNIELKTYRDMISLYGFDEEEQAMLEDLMNPEYRAAISPDGSVGGMETGGTIGAEKYQAILDAVSDENGKQVVAFALSKVGYPYSQAYRSSGNYYDCSSLAYYAWKAAGVEIGYGGSNTAAAEGRYCYENQYLVSFEEMQPGDLIFYSYGSNGRFMDITHVAVYVGEGNVVEAVSERVGVVCHAVPTGSIVFVGRPRG